MNIDDMKKIYITPEIEMINLLCFSPVANPLLEASPGSDNGNGETGNTEDDFDGEAADEYRGSWEGIWDNM